MEREFDELPQVYASQVNSSSGILDEGDSLVTRDVHQASASKLIESAHESTSGLLKHDVPQRFRAQHGVEADSDRQFPSPLLNKRWPSYVATNQRASDEISDLSTVGLWKAISKGNIDNTEQLIEFVNGRLDEERDLLISDILKNYSRVFGKQKLKTLSLRNLYAFVSLSQLSTLTDNAKRSMRIDWLGGLSEKAKEKQGDEALMRALIVALLSLDVDIFNGDAAQLTHLAITLINKLDASDEDLNKEAILKYCNIFCGLLALFHFIKWLGGNDWYMMTKEGGVLEQLKLRINELMRLSSDSFQLQHNAKQFQEYILDLKSEADIKPDRCELKLTKIACSLTNWSVTQWIIVIGTELQSIEVAAEELNGAVLDSRRQSSYQWLRSLNAIAHFVFKNAEGVGHYLKSLKLVRSNEERLLPSLEDRKHLRYGIIEQLMMLTLAGSPTIRSEIANQLHDLIASMDTEDVFSADPDILNLTSQCKALIRNQEQKEAGSHQGGPLCIDQEEQSIADSHSETLFSMVMNHLDEGQGNDKNLQKESDFTDPITEALKTEYRSKFVQVESYGQRGADVSNLKVNLKEITNRNQILHPDHSVELGSSQGRELVSSEFKTKIELSDLFPAEADVSKVLVIGMPGVGKTMLMHRLAVDWSDGMWGHQFETVFLLSVSKIHKAKTERSPSLTAAVIENCFSHLDIQQYLTELSKFVDEKLKLRTTLLIVDGLDEAKRDTSGFSRAILDQVMAESNNHKLLMMSRPNDLATQTVTSDVVVELEGLKDEDVRDYLSNEDAIVQLRMEEHPSLWGFAQNPRNFHILLRFMRSREGGSEASGGKSLARLYGDWVSDLWRSYPWASLDGWAIDIDNACEDLGKIALMALRLGRCRVPFSALDDAVFNCSDQLILIDTGFLLTNQNDDLEFTHSGVMQYFAGRHLAEMLLENKIVEVKQCIQKLKYGTRTSEVLSVIAGELGQERNEDSIQKLLTAIDEGDVEQPGLQHLGIKMNCLQQWYLDSRHTAIDQIDRKFHLSAELARWLKVGLRHVHKTQPSSDIILKKVDRLVRSCPDVVGCARGPLLRLVLNDVTAQKWKVDRSALEVLGSIIDLDPGDPMWLQTLEEAQRSPSQVRKAFIQCLPVLGQFSRQSIQHLLEALNSRNGIDGGKAYCSSLVELLRRAPELVGNHIENLKLLCSCMDYWTRMKIIKAMPEILNASSDLVNVLVAFLLEDDINIETKLTPITIELLGVCLEADHVHTSDIFRHLIESWRKLGDDQRNAVTQTFIKMIGVDASKAVEIVEDLLTEKEEAPWPTSYTMIRSILSSLGEISDNADSVLELLIQKYEVQKNDLHILALILEAIKQATSASADVLDALMPVLLEAVQHQEWMIRSLAFHATGAISNHHKNQLRDELIEAIVEACKKETVWKAQCSVFESAAELVASGIEHPNLIQASQDALRDKDDEIRKRAGKVLRAAAVQQTDLRSVLIDALSEAYWNASDDLKHGTVYCLHLLIQDAQETTPQMTAVLIDAAKQSSSMLCSVGVAALVDVMEIPGMDTSECFEVLQQICQRQEGFIRFSALEAIGNSTRQNPEHLAALIEILKTNLNPQNNEQWLIYLPLLKQAVGVPHIDKVELLKTLLKESTDELSIVKEARRSIVDRISLGQLLEWYDMTHEELLIQPILGRFYQTPVIMKRKQDSQEKIFEVYISDELVANINGRAMRQLKSHMKLSNFMSTGGHLIAWTYQKGIFFSTHAFDYLFSR